MSRPKHEVADIINRFGANFIQKHNPNSYQLRVLQALSTCRTSALGGHKYRCSNCNKEQIAYNSCRNRHCPKCQVAKQHFWVDDRISNAYKSKHYHLVFTIPEELNAISLLDSRWFYNQLFSSVWETLKQFGYTHYGAESGAICALHTWGQNLSLHPHVHCIVPALGYTLDGKMKRIGENSKYLYPVRQLSVVFRTKLLEALSKHLAKTGQIDDCRSLINQAWKVSWVVFSEASMAGAEHVMQYLGNYVHRVAISNSRIVRIDENDVSFKLKDYRDDGNIKTIKLKGEEFLRRFCMHILPKKFVKIRYYGIYSVRFRSTVLDRDCKMKIVVPETVIERIKRVMDIDVCKCKHCKIGRLKAVEIVPRVRSPSALYSIK